MHVCSSPIITCKKNCNQRSKKMAASDDAKRLRDLPTLILTSSTKERKCVFETLQQLLKRKDVPEGAIRGIAQLLPLALPRYTDSKSRSLVEQLVITLSMRCPETSFGHLADIFNSITEGMQHLHATPNLSRTCLTALRWLCSIIRATRGSFEAIKPGDFQKAVKAMSGLLSVITAAGNRTHVRKAFHQLSYTWSYASNSLNKFIEALAYVESTYQTIILSSYIFKHLITMKDVAQITKLKNGFLDAFIKTVIGSKNKPPLYVLEHSAPLLKHINHDEFRNLLLPMLQKALLRNPEVILQSVGYVVSVLSLDLSQYVLELGKTLGTSLHSKEDQLRDEAAVAIKNLALQCSDPDALEQLFLHLVGILNGSEGKLTVTAQRIGVITGFGYLSHNTVPANSCQALAAAASREFIKILQQEVHEGTLIHTLSMLALWCNRFTTEIPLDLIEWFKKGIALKTSTSAVRNSYFTCMNAAFHGNTLPQGETLIPILMKAVEKASAQPTQIAVVTEGLSACLLLLRLNAFNNQIESKLSVMWNILLDLERQIFVSEKFLVAASEDALGVLISVIERMYVDFPEKLRNDFKPYHHAIIYSLTRPSFVTRRNAAVTVKKLLSALGGGHLACALFKELSAFVHSPKTKFVTPDTNLIEQKSSVGPGDTSISVVGSFAIECVSVLTSVNSLDSTDSEVMLFEGLFGLHHPCIVAIHPELWIHTAKRLNLNPATVLKKNLNCIWTMVLEDIPLTATCTNVIRTLVTLCPDAILPLLVSHIEAVLKNPELNAVTKEDYAIFQTPEGQLYNKSAIESIRDEISQTKNIKRESKVYSYKEQMDEIDLRKELEAKKKAKGIKTEPQLTPKQLEMMKIQLAKEGAIRQHVDMLHQKVNHAAAIGFAALSTGMADVHLYCQRFVQSIVTSLKSLVSAPVAVMLHLELQKLVLKDHLGGLGLLIAHVILRLLDPACELDKSWSQEGLVAAANRSVAILHRYTVVTQDKDYDEIKEAAHLSLTAPAFTYVFPLLDVTLRNGGQKINQNEATMVKGLEVIVEHAQMRFIPGDDLQKLNNPALLPRKQMIDLLIDLLESTSGYIQNLAGRVLLQVAESATGKAGCTVPSSSEVESLLTALQSPLSVTRKAALECLQTVVNSLKNLHGIGDGLLARRLLVARFDPDEENRVLAEKLWTDVGLKVDIDLCEKLLIDIINPQQIVRLSAAEALSSILSEYPKAASNVLECLLETYREKLALPPPVLDEFGRVTSEMPIDDWESRSGIAVAINKIAAHLPSSVLSHLMMFFITEGLGDRHSEVQREMLEAAQIVVDVHGKDTVGILLPQFQDFLDKAPDSSAFDSVRQSVVVLMGGLARHLDKDDPKIRPIVTKLIKTLSTPSQQVQEAVANCLPPLVPSFKDEAPVLVKQLLQTLIESEKYGERRGAAYGLAGLVKGLGILSLKQLDIMSTLTEAIQDKKNYRAREGALFAFEMLCNMLGRLFEPYVVHVLPHLLLCFGDGNQHVREATDETAKAVMSKLSAHGVKLVLPSLLAALEEDSWRTKTGSIDLLGAMAFCAPKQLSACLPSIVPKLIEVLSDSHVRVQKAGAQALRQIGSVIRNPEIQALVLTLLDALQDPSKKTSPCLQTLLDTKFVHFIDAPSLALIMPVVQRAFQDRSTETRKMAAQIIGNMYSLTDQKDLAPYLPSVIPGLKQSLLDPVPEVRGVAARALGAMVKGMGESSFDDLLPWLMQTLTSDASSVDRSGAAQGLSEVVGGIGAKKLEKLMPDIIATAERTDIAPHVKDGYIMMFIYMPVVFQKEFTQYIGQIINPILKALADESEFVRDTALRAGQRIVNMYAESAITLLLPELEKGLFDDNWRIRYSSVQLLGDLLYKISGVSGKMTTETADEDDNFGTEQSHKAILSVLGADRRNRVLAGLYMGRSDIALMVRQAALHVWKVVVTNTPRTLREILPTLFSLLLGCLASTSYDKRQVAARTLGDLVRKLGERVLPDIIPILESGLESDRSDQRQGVCIGLSEIMASTSKEMVMTFVDSLVPTVRKALCDPLPEVRQAAAKTFDSLHSTVGHRALDDILSPLLKQLSNSQLGEYTLDGLRQVMAIKSKVVLPYLIPQLTNPPVNTKALSILASVGGDALTKHLNKVLPALLSALSEACDTPNEQQELEYCQAVVLSVADFPGVHMVMDELMEATKNKDVGVRRAATMLLYSYCSQTKADYSQYVSQLLKGLIHLFTDKDSRVLQLAWEALNSVTKDLASNVQMQHVSDVRQAVRFVVSDLGPDGLLPGFCLPKGIAPILPIFREAFINGTPEVKEQAAVGLGEVIRLTNAEALRPSVVSITGPLIRILGDRYSWNVRVAVLDTLALLLAKVGVQLKPFLPQLQTTFLKALSDPNRQVRLKAGAALSHLIVIHTRADPLFTELHTNVRNTDDPAVRETMLQALRSVISPAGDKMTDDVRQSVYGTLLGMLSSSEDTTRITAAGCLGALCRTLQKTEFTNCLHNILLDDDQFIEWTVRHGRCVALMVALLEAPARIFTSEYLDKVAKIILSYITADRVPICLSGIRCAGIYLKHQLLTENSYPQQMIQVLAKSMNHNSNEVKQLVAQVAIYLARSIPRALPDNILKPLLPMLVNGTKEKNSVVKSNSEFALVAVLRIRDGEETQQACMKLLDAGAREALGDVINKVLRKVASQPEPKEETLDDTILT